MSFISLCSSAQLTAEQERQVDSLKQVIENAEHDTTIVNSWVSWDKIIYVADPELDFELNKKIDSLCAKNLKMQLTPKEKNSFLNSQGFALYSFGIISNSRGNFAKAIDYYSDNLKIQEEIENKKGVAAALNGIGNVYISQGDYKKAIEYHNKSLIIKEEIGDKQGVGISLNNIGIIYQIQGDYKKAIEYHNKSLIIKEEMGDKYGVAASLNGIATVNTDQGNYIKAIEYHNKSLIIKEEIGDKKGVAASFHGIANNYSRQGNYKKAIEYHNKSLIIKEEMGDKYGAAISIGGLGLDYYQQGDYKKAEKYCARSLSYAQEIGVLTLIKDSSKNLWEIYKSLGQYKQALSMFELYITTRDSLESEENQKAVIRHEYKYQYEKQAAADSIKTAEADKVKDALIEAEQAKNERNELKLEQGEIEKKQQEQQSYFLFGGLALALIFGGFIFNRFRITKKQRDIIDEQKSVVESQKSLVEEQKEKVDKAFEQLEEKNTEIMDSITYAKRIQSAILPPAKLVKEYLNQSFILYKPKDIVAGDFYWMEPQDNGVLFAAADCTGHGVPGAMVSVVCNNGLNRSVREYGLTDPAKILDKTREIVISEFEKSEEEVKDGMDIAICSLQGRTLKYAGAHNPLWIIRANGVEVEEIKANKQPIGKYDAPMPYTTHSIELNEGDSFYIFSDGYADQFGGERGKKYKTANFKKLLLSIQNESIEKQHTLIDEAFESWKGKLEQLDDVCVIGVRV